MQAQNFLTPAELEITDAEHGALVTVLGMLERGEIKALPKKARLAKISIDNRLPTMFYMGAISAESNCGTACCLLGWAYEVSKGTVFDKTNEALPELFYPGEPATNSRDPRQGAAALRNFLTTGEARWDEVMAESA